LQHATFASERWCVGGATGSLANDFYDWATSPRVEGGFGPPPDLQSVETVAPPPASSVALDDPPPPPPQLVFTPPSPTLVFPPVDPPSPTPGNEDTSVGDGGGSGIGDGTGNNDGDSDGSSGSTGRRAIDVSAPTRHPD
jgi:hypothetical protein